MFARTGKGETPVERCRICKRALKDDKVKPFCSKRCADVDLGRWLKGSYAIPTQDRPSHVDEDEF